MCYLSTDLFDRHSDLTTNYHISYLFLWFLLVPLWDYYFEELMGKMMRWKPPSLCPPVVQINSH
jgi:hypothetical protein